MRYWGLILLPIAVAPDSLRATLYGFGFSFVVLLIFYTVALRRRKQQCANVTSLIGNGGAPRATVSRPSGHG